MQEQSVINQLENLENIETEIKSGSLQSSIKQDIIAHNHSNSLEDTNKIDLQHLSLLNKMKPFKSHREAGEYDGIENLNY